MSIDAFLQELFPPMPPQGGGGPDNFASRFGAMPTPMMDTPPASTGPTVPGPGGPAGPPGPGGDDGSMLPPNANPMGGQAPSDIMARLAGNPAAANSMAAGTPADLAAAGAGDVPLPRPRPGNLGPGDIMARGDIDPSAGAGPQTTGSGNPVSDAFSRLSGRFTGWQPGGGTPVPTPADQPDNASGAMGRLMGLTDTGEKRMRNALAGGMAGGNPAFAGGAFMKGASGGLSGGLKSDKEDTDAATSDAEKTQKQANFDRTQGDKEKTSDALRKLYGDRGQALTTRANQPAAGSKAWNKPPHERYKDAMKLIQDERKATYGQINPLGPKADVTAQRAEADKHMADFTANTLKTYGIDRTGNETAPPAGNSGVLPTGKVIGDQEAKDKGLYPKGTYDDPAAPESQEEFDALPAGTIFKNPADGRMMTKRG